MMEVLKMALTPMMRQYFEIKENYKDCILFFRLGDFYEMFFVIETLLRLIVPFTNIMDMEILVLKKKKKLDV